MNRQEAKQLTDNAVANYESEINCTSSQVISKVIVQIESAANKRQYSVWFSVKDILSELKIVSDETNFVTDVEKAVKSNLANDLKYTVSPKNDGYIEVVWS